MITDAMVEAAAKAAYGEHHERYQPMMRRALEAATLVPWPYGGCELSADVPCDPFNCCEICQVPGAGKHKP